MRIKATALRAVVPAAHATGVRALPGRPRRGAAVAITAARSSNRRSSAVNLILPYRVRTVVGGMAAHRPTLSALRELLLEMDEIVQTKIALTGILCLLAIAGCSSGSAASGGSATSESTNAANSIKGNSNPANGWYQKGFQFARQSVAKGQPSDNASNFVNSNDGDRLTWCDEAYAPGSDPGAPANTQYDGVTTNAPPVGEDKASVQAYSKWISGCAAGLLTASTS